jgi:hypothetical protein
MIPKTGRAKFKHGTNLASRFRDVFTFLYFINYSLVPSLNTKINT